MRLRRLYNMLTFTKPVTIDISEYNDIYGARMWCEYNLQPGSWKWHAEERWMGGMDFWVKPITITFLIPEDATLFRLAFKV